ncbi:hypothetical protein DM806_09920 [Sphingobium lactosutens]|uniref:hypothetical protein n=1 Tax=Sphingobium lactosutens TaxID=522773 RepID=UPI0015BDBAA8|nr:hypothetical protein [Sphingobium lactosutens]NWK95985.1 hypothetical protein [Sphingobium lactosutens]
MIATAFRPFGLALVASALLASCTGLSPESRLRSGLIDAGLSPKMAGCMAERMASRLSIVQLRRLQSIASLRKSHKEEMTVGHFIHKVRALQDPEIIAITSKAAFACAF